MTLALAHTSQTLVREPCCLDTTWIQTSAEERERFRTNIRIVHAPMSLYTNPLYLIQHLYSITLQASHYIPQLQTKTLCSVGPKVFNTLLVAAIAMQQKTLSLLGHVSKIVSILLSKLCD